MIRRFNRYELKYVLPLAQLEAIVADLSTMADGDPHGGAAGYRVISLYYDSPQLDFFWAKIEGIKYRRKLRLRVYVGDELGSIQQAMVEIKQRINRTVQKRRLQLPLGEAEALCRGELDREDLDTLDQQVASEVRYLVNAMHLKPSCITAYHRRAFVGGHYDAGLRVTFDTDLRCRTHALQINEQAVNQLFAPPDWCIMEVKVNDSVPDWITSLLARHNCQLRRVSKYCAGLARARGLNRLLPFVLPAACPSQEKVING